MSNYGRVPNMELSVEEKKEEKEEEVFVEPVDEKKQKLKDHLAKCREKSMAVRKAKKEEKLANKKPVGRPATKAKPKKEEAIPTTYQPAPEYVSSEEEEEEQEEEVFTEKPKPKPKQKVIKKPQAYKNVATSETMDYDRLADMVASKLRPPVQAPTYHEPPSNNFGFGNYEQMRAYENKIRDEERNKYQLEHNTKQQEKAKRLEQQTKQYFRKMPSVNFHKEPSNMWDDAFNPRR